MLTVVLDIIFFLWLIVLTFLILKLYRRFTAVIPGREEKSILAVLEKLIKEGSMSAKEIGTLTLRVEKMEQKDLLHIQKTGLVYFNPFRDTGGEQSFILALLDAQDSGVVISGLYARSGMRWYIKKIVNGKGTEHELSEEELKAVRSAK